MDLTVQLFIEESDHGPKDMQHLFLHNLSERRGLSVCYPHYYLYFIAAIFFQKSWQITSGTIDNTVSTT